MHIKSAEYIKGSKELKACPKTSLPEFAFCGRSNVGKSSLINMLTGRKSLAKTSGTPGKTRLINHYLINNEWYLVDLPGLGYAKSFRAETSQWEKMIAIYLTGRKNLFHTFLVVDIRHHPQAIDIELIGALSMAGISFSLVFTKTDKLSRTALLKNISVYEKEIRLQWNLSPLYFIISATKKLGKNEILDFISSKMP